MSESSAIISIPRAQDTWGKEKRFSDILFESLHGIRFLAAYMRPRDVPSLCELERSIPRTRRSFRTLYASARFSASAEQFGENEKEKKKDTNTGLSECSELIRHAMRGATFWKASRPVRLIVPSKLNALLRVNSKWDFASHGRTRKMHRCVSHHKLDRPLKRTQIMLFCEQCYK